MWTKNASIAREHWLQRGFFGGSNRKNCTKPPISSSNAYTHSMSMNTKTEQLPVPQVGPASEIARRRGMTTRTAAKRLEEAGVEPVVELVTGVRPPIRLFRLDALSGFSGPKIAA